MAPHLGDIDHTVEFDFGLSLLIGGMTAQNRELGMPSGSG
jgi:hypothetical protein